jgi:hypothetical protein
MNRLFLLVPALALVGCDKPAPSTPAAGPVAAATAAASARPEPTATAPRATNTPTAQAPARTTTTGPDRPVIEPDPPFRAPEIEEKKEDPPEEAPPIPDTYKPLNKGKTIFFEKAADGARRVHLLTEVVLREGPLEVFLCKLNTKEHEAILHIDADAREIHFALVAAGAVAGSPAKFVPEYKPATGTKIKVTVTYREKGKVKTAPAADWVTDKVSGKHLAHDWVFAGSRFFKDPEGKNPDYYMANNGEVISLSNFPDSMMDLPVKSSKDAADLIFEADTAKIPPLRSPVLVTLEPVVEKKK